MRKTSMLLALAATLAAGAMGTALAAPALPGADRAAEHLTLIDRAAYVYRGRSYCFYLDGWHGPGWYWCGYATRHGYGWGGGEGWRGWHYRAPVHRAPAHRAPVHRSTTHHDHDHDHH